MLFFSKEEIYFKKSALQNNLHIEIEKALLFFFCMRTKPFFTYQLDCPVGLTANE